MESQYSEVRGMTDASLSHNTTLFAPSPDDIRLFYERLLLWHVLRPNGVRRAMPVRTRWQHYLDSLAFLCDTHIGGSTVSALVVQDRSTELCYWVARNSKTDVGVSRLSWLLRQLHSLQSTDPILLAEDRILGEVVGDCKRRIDDYHRRLGIVMKEALGLAKNEGENRSYISRHIEFYLTVCRRKTLFDRTSRHASGGEQSNRFM
jgi:hypothetical protein